jgi:uncharacterized membrane protein
MKTLLAIWVAALAALIVRILYYAAIRGQYATSLDAQSMDAYGHADNMVALSMKMFLAVMFIGPLLIGILAGYQSYREAHPRSSAPKNAEYWDKAGWRFLMSFLALLFASCVTMTWSLPLGVLGLLPSAYLFFKGVACLDLNLACKYEDLEPESSGYNTP